MKKKPALIVTFNPLPDFFSTFDTFYFQFEQIIIVDNGSDSKTRRLLEIETQKQNRSLTILFNESNLGIATALNQGFRWALTAQRLNVHTFER